MLKVAPCTDARTVISPIFFGLMGYYYHFVSLWGYVLRAPLLSFLLNGCLINLVLVLRHTFEKRSQTNRRHKNKLFWERNSLESLKAPKSLLIQDLSMRQIFHTNAGFALCSSVVQLLWRRKSYIVKSSD